MSAATSELGFVCFQCPECRLPMKDRRATSRSLHTERE